MDLVLQLIGQYGVLVVFVAVLLEQGGLPVPAYPLLILASSLAVESGEALWPIVLAAVAGALLADLAWFAGGHRVGARLIRLICSLAPSPDACAIGVRDTYSRWGLPSLIIAKFVPGLAAVATTMAGQTRVPVSKFILFDGLGAALWVGVAVLLGVAFHDVVSDVLAYIEGWGRYGLVLLTLLAGLYLFLKWRQRRQRFERDIAGSGLPVDESGLCLGR